MKHPHYQCPLCQLPLSVNTQGFNCSNKHQFDLAKEGYVNLLPVQNKSSKVPGDSKTMVMARRAFLSSGAYAFLRQAVTQQVKYHTISDATIIDLGCGEGYYTQALSEQAPQQSIYGVDIAKPAIRYAAKRDKAVNFSVASHLNLPFADNFAGMICKIFAPMTCSQVLRVLKPQGLLLSVVPGPKHLLELKQIIYDYPKLHQAETCPEGLSLISSRQLTEQQTLKEQRQIASLSQMTPFAWKINDEKRQQLIQSGDFTVTFDFVINLYRN
jgi:23S rRNA (guanine745-N1)-methyltransferase